MVSINPSEIVLTVVYFASLYFTVFWLLTLLETTETKKKKWKIWPTVSVLIPAYNEEDSIEETVTSVLSLDYPKDKIKVYIINDGSKDRTQEIAEKISKENQNVFLINQVNGGKANAINNALKLVNSEFTATLDADSFVMPLTLKKLLSYFTEKDIAAVLPAMKIKNPKNILQRMQRIEYTVNLFYRLMNEKLNCIHVTPGPFPLYRTKVLKEINGFDEHCITEDLELAIRIQKHNYRILQTYEAEVYTIPPNTIKGLYYQRKRWYKGGLLASMKHRDLMFNKSYGDFGYMRMPSMIILPFLSITMFISFVNDIRLWVTRGIEKLIMIDFDVFTLFRGFELHYNLLDIKFTSSLIIVISALMAIVITFYAHKLIKEKISLYGKPVSSLAYYMFVHPIFLAFVFIVVTYSAIFDKNYKWYSAGKRAK